MRRPEVPQSATRVRDPTPWLVIAAILVAALSFRAPVLVVAPIADNVGDALGLSTAQVGLLTTVPVLCFGMCAPWASALAKRTGFDIALLIALATIIGGLAVRSIGVWSAAFLGCVIIGLGITIGNIIVPAILRRDVAPRHQAIATSSYTGTMNIGAMMGTLSIVPLTGLVGWQWGLAAWIVITATALALWSLVTFARPQTKPARSVESARAAAQPATPRTPVRRHPLAWLLALAFAGQVSAYYSVAAWLPQILRDDAGLSPSRAGAVTSWFQVLAIAGALLLSAALRRVSWTGVSVMMSLLWLACPALLLLNPSLYLIAATLGGVAQGAGLTALFVLIMQRSESDRRAAEYSAFVQGIGYIVSAVAPFTVGALHTASDSWTMPLLLVVAYLGLFTIGQCAAVRRPTPAAEHD